MITLGRDVGEVDGLSQARMDNSRFFLLRYLSFICFRGHTCRRNNFHFLGNIFLLSLLMANFAFVPEFWVMKTIIKMFFPVFGHGGHFDRRTGAI